MAFKTTYLCGCFLEDDVSPTMCPDHNTPAVEREVVEEEKKSKKKK